MCSKKRLEEAANRLSLFLGVREVPRAYALWIKLLGALFGLMIFHDPCYSLQMCEKFVCQFGTSHETKPALLRFFCSSQAASRHRDLEIMQGQLKMAKMRTSTHRNSGHQVGKKSSAADGSDGSNVVDGRRVQTYEWPKINKYMR